MPSGGSVVYLEGPHGDPGLIELIPATPGMDEMFTRFWQTTTNWTGHDRIRPFGFRVLFAGTASSQRNVNAGANARRALRRKQHDVLAQERHEQRVRQRRGQEKGAPPGKEDDDGAGGDEQGLPRSGCRRRARRTSASATPSPRPTNGGANSTTPAEAEPNRART